VQKIAHFSPLLADHNNTMNRTVSPMEGSPLPVVRGKERDLHCLELLLSLPKKKYNCRD